eukprot:3565829-Amphidinium_carterae.1
MESTSATAVARTGREVRHQIIHPPIEKDSTTNGKANPGANRPASNTSSSNAHALARGKLHAVDTAV